MIKRFFITLIFILVVLVAGLGYYLSDEETLKKELSAQMRIASGYQVEILGDLNWQVVPKLGLAATNIKLHDGEIQIHVSKIRVGLSLSELTKSPEKWRLEDLILNEVRIKEARFRVQEFAMQGFALGQATPFQSQILMLKAGEPSEVREGAAPVNLSGTLTYALSDSKAVPSATLSYLIISQTTVNTRLGEIPVAADCTAWLKEIDGAAVSQTDTLDIFNGQMDCTLAQFSVRSVSWPESEVSLAVEDGKLSTTLQAANGSINIQKFKETVTSISALAGKENPAANWPNVMQYQRLLITASLQDERVVVDANLDNLDVAMRGTLAQADSVLNLKGNLTVQRATADQLIRLDPLFTRLPLPFYCRGTAAEPDCGPDTSAAMSIVGELAKREGKRVIQEKVQESLLDVIEEKLPEEFREKVEQLLNLFTQ